MLVSEIIDSDSLKYYKKIENPESIGTISHSTTEHQYKVKSVIFDNEYGLGNVPNNKNVNYLGFTAVMKIDDFLNLAADHEEQRNETAKDIKELIDQGYGIATPWLEIEMENVIDGKGIAKIVGHEGRARAICCQKYFGLTEMPIHFFPKFLRSRHISNEHINSLNKDGIQRERSSAVIKNALKQVIKD